MPRTTHTYATLEVSEATYAEIHDKLDEAGYQHAFHDGAIDMRGIALLKRTLASGTPVAGHLQVGTNGNGEVVVNHPDLKPDADGVGHIVFSPKQARILAAHLVKKSVEAEQEGNTSRG